MDDLGLDDGKGLDDESDTGIPQLYTYRDLSPSDPGVQTPVFLPQTWGQSPSPRASLRTQMPATCFQALLPLDRAASCAGPSLQHHAGHRSGNPGSGAVSSPKGDSWETPRVPSPHLTRSGTRPPGHLARGTAQPRTHGEIPRDAGKVSLRSIKWE